MGLAESQRLLARLATDGSLRARFADDPDSVLGEFGVSPDEIESIGPIAIEDFARSLIRKRRGEAESLLPMTARAIGPARFASEFGRHAREFVPTGIKKHRDDAIAFAGSLARTIQEPAWLGDLARFEATALLAHDPARRWTSLRLGHHPAAMARSAVVKTKPTWVVWYRIKASGPLRRLILSRPW